MQNSTRHLTNVWSSLSNREQHSGIDAIHNVRTEGQTHTEENPKREVRRKKQLPCQSEESQENFEVKVLTVPEKHPGWPPKITALHLLCPPRPIVLYISPQRCHVNM